MYKKLLWTATLVASLALGQTVFADSSDCRQGLKTMVESLKLMDAQKEKIKPVLEELKASVASSASQMTDLESQINKQVHETNMDKDTVNGLIDKKAKLIGDIIKAKASAKNQIINIITPEQQAKFQSKLKKVEEKMAAKYSRCHDEN